MDVEERLVALEHEVKVLKGDIQKTLIEIQATLPERSAAPRWQKRAWILALLNVMLAVVLFANIYLYLPGNMPFAVDPKLEGWLRAGWISVAFIWLLLQMYPLVLLLGQEDSEWQNVGLRNATAFIKSNPGYTLMLTFAILIVALINTVVPAAWIIVALILLIAVGSMAAWSILELLRERMRA